MAMPPMSGTIAPAAPARLPRAPRPSITPERCRPAAESVPDIAGCGTASTPAAPHSGSSPPSQTPHAARPTMEDRPAHTSAASQDPLGASQQPTLLAPLITSELAIRRFISTAMLSTHSCRPRVACSDRAKATTLPLSGSGVSAPVR
jgi:hypothetical protein